MAVLRYPSAPGDAGGSALLMSRFDLKVAGSGLRVADPGSDLIIWHCIPKRGRGKVSLILSVSYLG